MSEPVRVAFVVEGQTDLLMLEAAVARLLDGREMISTLLQPQDSAILHPTGMAMPGGWAGIYHWCHQTRATGRLARDPLFSNHDILIVQIDADVARKSYQSAHIHDPSKDLPCDKPCPPPSHTANALRAVVLRWMGETALPPRTVLCVPCQSLETWVAAALYPADPAVKATNFQCRPDPDALLAGKPKARRLISSGKKNIERYRDQAGSFASAWPAVRVVCSQAERFATDFLAAIVASPA